MKWNAYLISAAIASMTLAACSEDDPVNPDNNKPDTETPDTETPTEETVEGDVSGVWEANSVIKVSGHIVVPEGESLTIQEGVQVIFDDAGVGANHAPIEFTVDGNLYCEGTAENPIRLTVAEEDRTEANTFAGLWGGIVASNTCAEMLIDHTIIEYTGGQVIEGSPAATNGIYTAGDDAYPQITTNNINGKYVITNSIIRNGWSDGIYLMGGQAIIANNTFAANGYDGAEAVNVKAGCQADVANNIMFSPNTNGLKLSSSGQSENRGQAKIQAYNNTIINAGWRRDGEKGGCIYVEKNALANVFNNLIVNCKFRAMTPSFDIPNDPEEGYADASVIDYNYYASGSQKSDITFEEESGVAYAWAGYNYEHENYNQGVVDANSVIATETDSKDPQFVNFDINEVALTSYTYDSAWDFHVNAGSPVLTGAYSGSDAFATPLFGTSGLNVNGKNYTSPAVQAQFGAFGAN
ncbi:hypothetical protein NEE14_004255 [Parabacteroides sp. AD58]|uniref:Right-handed parallel beta-helix repeat-containing protein n=1 Tax=Parabacteroides absconsus TaxID=2951805 RepID=A0ABZ2IMG5_9BACT|nr:hypothetical protein [Parabacteroides sp. AD58]MCM6903385.1 hypothetical protein [Parabacteroides sp. AD58]